MAAITPTVKLTLSGKMQPVTVNDYYAGERFIVDVVTGDFADPIDPLVMVIAASRGAGTEEAISKQTAVPTGTEGTRRWDFPASTFSAFEEGSTFYFDVFLYEGSDLTREPVVRFQGSTTKKVTINPGPPPVVGGGDPITADTAPQLAAADDADTPADVFTAGAYSSSAGTIDSAVTTYLVNGSAEASSYDLAAGDTLQVTELVTDSAGNSRTFSTGLVTVTLSEEPAGISITSTDGVASVSNYTPQVDDEITVTPDGGSPTTYTVTQAMVDDYGTAGAFLLKQPEASGTTGLGDTVTYGGEIIVHDSGVAVARTYETLRLDAVVDTGPSYTITQNDIDLGFSFQAKVVTGEGTIYSDDVVVIFVEPYAEDPFQMRTTRLVGPGPTAPANPFTYVFSFVVVEEGYIINVQTTDFNPPLRMSGGNLVALVRNESGGSNTFFDNSVAVTAGDRVNVALAQKPSSDGIASDGRSIYWVSVNGGTPYTDGESETSVNTYLSEGFEIGGIDADLYLFFVEEAFLDFETDPTILDNFFNGDGSLKDPALLSGQSPLVHMRDQDFATGTNRGSGADYTVENV